eukprot:126808-Chlamydomonas_euryale.AAC.2
MRMFRLGHAARELYQRGGGKREEAGRAAGCIGCVGREKREEAGRAAGGWVRVFLVDTLWPLKRIQCIRSTLSA